MPRPKAMSLWINPATGDIEIDPETGFVSLADGTDEVTVGLIRRLSTWQGEWFWDGRDGVPWDHYLGKAGALAYLQLDLLLEASRDARIERMLDLRVAEYDPQTRKVIVYFVAAFAGDVVRATMAVGGE